MEVTVNGEIKELNEGMTIVDLLLQYSYKTVMVAVEHNKRILKREDFPTTKISGGDKIEIISFVGGG